MTCGGARSEWEINSKVFPGGRGGKRDAWSWRRGSHHSVGGNGGYSCFSVGFESSYASFCPLFWNTSIYIYKMSRTTLGTCTSINDARMKVLKVDFTFGALPSLHIFRCITYNQIKCVHKNGKWMGGGCWCGCHFVDVKGWVQFPTSI